MARVEYAVAIDRATQVKSGAPLKERSGVTWIARIRGR